MKKGEKKKGAGLEIDQLIPVPLAGPFSAY